MLKKLDWLSVKQKLNLHVLLLVKKIINCEVPQYLADEVQYVNQIHEHDTRQVNNLFYPSAKSAFGEKSILNTGFQQYNNLPSEIKDIKSTKLFKKNCVMYLRNQNIM
jgi:Uri superfamily endonuclease